MTAPTPNAELAYRVLDTARAVDRLDMDEWSTGDEKPIGLAELTAVETCGTTACLAGWTAAMHGLKVDIAGRAYDASGTDVGHVEYVAADLLGISSGQAHDLFYAENEDLDEAFVEVFGPRPEPVDEQAWRECAHRADYTSPAHHARECAYHRGEVDEWGRPVDDVPPNAGSAS